MTEPSIDAEPKRHWLTGKRLVAISLAVLVLLRVGVELIPTPLQIGPETTVIDGPLREDGTIDYAAHINDEWAAGVTPDQNAAVSLLRAFGPDIIEDGVRTAYFDRLGISVLPQQGNYLIDFHEFIKSREPKVIQNGERFEELEQQHADAMSRPWTVEELPEVAAWLDANQQPLAAILEACQQPRYFSPMVPSEDGLLISALMMPEQRSREAARLLMAQAMLELGRGDVERAFELTFNCHRLARHISEHPTLIGTLIAIAIDSIAAEGDAAIVLDARLTADQAAEYRERLRTLPAPPPFSDVIDRGERFIGLDATLAVCSGRISEEDLQLPVPGWTWIVDPNPTMRELNHVYDESLAALKLADLKERERAFAKIDSALSNRDRASLSLEWWLRFAVYSRSAISEKMGTVMASMLAPAIEQATTADDRHTIRMELCDIGYALAEYRATHGRFPESLNSLVPAHLDSLPLDLYTGDPLKYQLTDRGFLLYSVGKNGIDDGGVMGMSGDDIAFGDRPKE